MNNKPLKKVCTKCLDVNTQLQLNSDFFVDVQYGICDCCGNRGIVIPVERFFNTNTRLTPCTAEDKHKETLEPTQYEADILHLHGRIDKLIKEVEEVKRRIELAAETKQEKHPSPKQPKNAKVDGDAAYE
jgi:hypothetical protein